MPEPVVYRDEDFDHEEEFSTSWVLQAIDEHKSRVSQMNMHEELDSFYLEGRQGMNTFRACKKPADGIRGVAAAGAARDFVSQYFTQRTLTCHYARYGEYTATVLCLVWCCRMSYFWEFFNAFACEDGFIFTDQFITEFELPPDLQEKVAAIPRDAKHAQRKLNTILNLMPRLGSNGVSDAESA